MGFMAACESGSLSKVKSMMNPDLFSEADIARFITSRDDKGRSSYSVASQNGHPEIEVIILDALTDLFSYLTNSPWYTKIK